MKISEQITRYTEIDGCSNCGIRNSISDGNSFSAGAINIGEGGREFFTINCYQCGTIKEFEILDPERGPGAEAIKTLEILKGIFKHWSKIEISEKDGTFFVSKPNGLDGWADGNDLQMAIRGFAEEFAQGNRS